MEEVPFFTIGPIAVDGIEERARQSEPGAVVSFQGVVRRDRTQEGDVTALEFEAYETMGELEMAKILEEVKEKWPGTNMLWQHRLGRIPVGETSLFLVVSSPCLLYTSVSWDPLPIPGQRLMCKGRGKAE